MLPVLPVHSSRQTAAGWRSKSIEQSRWGDGQPGQGVKEERRRGGTGTGAGAPITTLASGVQ